MGVGKGGGGGKSHWILKISSKKVVFLVSSGKKQFHHFWAPLEEFWKKTLVPSPLEKILPTPMVPGYLIILDL